MLICTVCSMRAILKHGSLETAPPTLFDETPQQHLQRCHPDPAATAREKAELEEQIMQMIDADHAKRRTRAENAGNN